MARLVIFDESVRGVDLPARSVVLGRSREADVPIHDTILSRKHCAIEPFDSGWRLVDLGSSNGTYLNGARVESSPLKFDDVIEIGNTVIILLDGNPGAARSGLGQLRNPSKARELVASLQSATTSGAPHRDVQRASRRIARKPEKGVGRGSRIRDKRKLRAFEAVFAKWASTELLTRPAAAELIEGYVFHHIVSVAAKHSGELRAILTSVLEQVLGPDSFSGDSQALREKIHTAVAEALAKHKASLDRRS